MTFWKQSKVIVIWWSPCLWWVEIMSCNWTNEDLKLSGLTGTNYLGCWVYYSWIVLDFYKCKICQYNCEMNSTWSAGVWYITGISLWHPSWLYKVLQVDMVVLRCEMWCGMAFLCCTGIFSLKFMAPRIRKSKRASAKKTNSVQIEKGGII